MLTWICLEISEIVEPAPTIGTFGMIVLINLGPRGFESKDPFGRPGRDLKGFVVS